jgi:AcrR family transcriptional regulator
MQAMVGRPALVTPDEILDGALFVLSHAGVGAVTMRAVRDELGISNGSLFHAFATREELLGALWMRSAARFEAEFIGVLESGPPRSAVPAAAVCVLSFARTHRAEAALLARDGRSEMAPRTRGGGTSSRRLERALRDAAAALAPRRQEAARRAILFATIHAPYGVVKSALAAGRVPDDTDEELVRVAASAVIRVFGRPKARRTRPK